LKKRKFEEKITVSLPSDMVDFLESLIEKGVAENMSQAIRKCVNFARANLAKQKDVM